MGATLTTKERDVLAAFDQAGRAGRPERNVVVAAGDLAILTDLCRRLQRERDDALAALAADDPTDLS